MAIVHFAVPFVLLLMRPIKRNSTALACIAGLVLFMQLVFAYYQVTPDFSAAGIRAHWMDLLVPLGLGGIWLAHFIWQLHRYPLVPLYDYNRATALHLRQLDAEEAAREEALSYG